VRPTADQRTKLKTRPNVYTLRTPRRTRTRRTTLPLTQVRHPLRVISSVIKATRKKWDPFCGYFAKVEPRVCNGAAGGEGGDGSDLVRNQEECRCRCERRVYGSTGTSTSNSTRTLGLSHPGKIVHFLGYLTSTHSHSSPLSPRSRPPWSEDTSPRDVCRLAQFPDARAHM